MQFKKYQHLERFGTTEVENIEIGTCYIFPKLDGTNASVWLRYLRDNDYQVCAGSRNRELSIDNDNAGFLMDVMQNTPVINFLSKNTDLRLYGEWLVPHSLKTYREDAWRKFYVFDVCRDKEDGEVEYLSYEVYSKLLEEAGINYIPPIGIIKNSTYEKLLSYLKANTFLVEDGKGAGEGIVIKNYDYKNKFGRTTWAKIVTSEFKEQHTKVMGASVVVNKMIEEDIVEKYCSKALIEKVHAKIINDNGGWSSKNIPQLLNVVYYDLVREESWNFVKEFKNPTINYKTLQCLVTNKIKEVKRELF